MNIVKEVYVSPMLTCSADKHRFIVDVSFDNSVTSDYAKLYLQSALNLLKSNDKQFKRYNFDEMASK